jgi:hypothetical protein
MIIASRPRHAGTKLTALMTALKIMMPTIQANVPAMKIQKHLLLLLIALRRLGFSIMAEF